MANKKGSSKRRRGHYCKICGETKANEKFSGKGHAAHICKDCMKLTPSERSAEVALRRIEGMAFRKINEADTKWLRNRMKDKEPQIHDAACEVHRLKFPHHERNAEKRNLHVKSLELYIHGEVCDGYGDEISVHARLSLNKAGDLYCFDYDMTDTQSETRKSIGIPTAKKLLNVVVHNMDAPFWAEDLSDAYYDYDPNLDILPDFLDDIHEYDLGEEDQEDVVEEASPETEHRKPLWSLSIGFTNGEARQMTFFNQMHDQPQELYWMLIELLREDTEPEE